MKDEAIPPENKFVELKYQWEATSYYPIVLSDVPRPEKISHDMKCAFASTKNHLECNNVPMSHFVYVKNVVVAVPKENYFRVPNWYFRHGQSDVFSATCFNGVVAVVQTQQQEEEPVDEFPLC